VLAPHFSTLGVGEYLERLDEEGAALGLSVGRVERFGADPAFISLLAGRVEVALGCIASPLDRTEVLFSAHSLPERILAVGDPYPAELAETAALVAAVADLTRFRPVWQSASRTPEPWLGPDISEVMSELAGNSTSGVVVCPAGFTSDHLEVLYDLDIVARRHAEELGLAFQRTASLNADPVLMEALAELVVGADPAAG
jgi:protoporphyrin/coproporphyrin ferrochelatase